MKFFEFLDNTAFEKKWCFASKIEPTSPLVDWRCSVCGRSARYPANTFNVTVEKGTDFPDVLQCGPYPLLVVSARVLQSWHRNSIGPIQAYSVKVTGAENTALKPTDAPEYFRIEVCGSAKIDITKSGGKIVQPCLVCGGFRTEPMLMRSFALMAGSWDGSSIFRDQRLFPSLNFCVESVKQAAEQEHFTNIQFREMMPS